MSDIKDFIPNYERACTTWPDASNLRHSVDAVHRSAEGLQHGLIEHVKSCIECICITILNDRGVQVPDQPTGVVLLRQAMNAVGLQNTRGQSKLDEIVTSYNRLAEGIIALRNERGVVGHGQDGFLDAIAKDHLRSFLFIGDAIVGCLLAAYDGTEPNLASTREPFERFADKSSLIDQSVALAAEIETADDGTPLLVVEASVGTGQIPTVLRVEPSRLLFHVERDAYVDLLSQSLKVEQLAADESAEDETFSTSAAVFEALSGESAVKLAAAAQREYLGTLDPLRGDVEALLAPMSFADEKREMVVTELLTDAEHGMGPDWRERPSLAAGLRVAFMATLRSSGIDNHVAKQEAIKLYQWLSQSESVKDLEAEQREGLDD